MMIRTLALLSVVALLTACPGGNGIGGEGEGESAIEGMSEGESVSEGISEGEPALLNNSVEIQNATNPNSSPADIIQVSVELSGTAESNSVDIRDDPIGPHESRKFCCYADGTYDVRAVLLYEDSEQDEGLEGNNVFIGPRTHVFTVGGRPAQVNPVPK